MRKIILTAFVALAALGAQAKGWTQEQVDATIVKVNNYWQQHNKAEVRSFWDNAAYHTGNMEAYKLLGKTEWIDYKEGGGGIVLLAAWKLVSNDAKHTVAPPNAKPSTLLQGCFLCFCF